MSGPNWNKAPSDAEAWAPETHKFMEGFYRTDTSGTWYFTTSKCRSHAEWWRIDRPSTYRQRQMVRRP